MGDVGSEALRMGGGMEKGSLSVSKMTRAFESLVVQTLGVNREVAVLGSVLGDFAVGGVVVAGVVGGLALVGAAYKALTEGSRKLREESDKMTASLVAQARAAREASVAGAEDLKLIAEMNLQSIKRESGVGIGSVITTLLRGGNPTISAGDAEAQSKRIADATTAVEQATVNVGKAWEAANKPMATAVSHLTDMNTELTRYAELMRRTYGTLGTVGHDFAGPPMDPLERIRAAERQANDTTARGLAFAGIPGGVDISDSVKIAGNLGKEINDTAKENARMLSDVISNTASLIGSIVASAINIGGGGRGSSIGGALGGTIGGGLGAYIGKQLTTAGGAYVGGALGRVVGSVIPVVGTVIGGLLGSAIGGLFDHHKKAVDNNTAAVDRNTQALLLFAPSGYKVAGGRYDASHLRQLGSAARRYASRGGVPILSVGTV